MPRTRLNPSYDHQWRHPSKEAAYRAELTRDRSTKVIRGDEHGQ